MHITKLRLFDSGGLRSELAYGAVGSCTLKAISTLLSLLISVVLARALAPEGYGIYAFAFSVMSLLAVPIQLGLPTLLVREVARYQHSARWDLLRGILQRANQIVLLLSLMVGLLTVVIGWWLADRVEETQLATLGWALLLLPILALNRLRGAALQGLRRVVMGQLPEMLLMPGALLMFLGIALLIVELTPPQAMALYCAATAATFSVGTVMLMRALPPEVRTARARHDTGAWARSILPLSLIGGLAIIKGQTDIFMLGLLGSKADVGMYRVALAGAGLVIFALTAVNTVLAPHVARLHSAGDRERLQRIVTISARIIFAAALPMAVALILFGESMLDFVYGDAYRSAYAPLAILCLGQTVNAGMGSVALILNMTGHERETVKGVAFAALVNVLLNAALIPPFGGTGAASASVATLVAVNLVLKLTPPNFGSVCILLQKILAASAGGSGRC